MPNPGPLTPAILRDVLRASMRSTLALADYNPAGVLVPIMFIDTSPHLLFTKRTDQVETHKGQVSFPGGMVEPGDRDIVDTALREAREEIGLRAADAEILGLLDDLATPTGFVITPVVALIRPGIQLAPNAEEVAETFDVPLSLFADPGKARKESRFVRGEERDVWHFDTGRHIVWGATASIVRSLLRALGMM